MDTFGIEARQFFGWCWLLDCGTIGGRDIGSRLVFGSKGRIVVKTEEDDLSVAGNGEVAFAVGVIPLDSDATKYFFLSSWWLFRNRRGLGYCRGNLGRPVVCISHQSY